MQELGIIIRPGLTAHIRVRFCSDEEYQIDIEFYGLNEDEEKVKLHLFPSEVELLLQAINDLKDLEYREVLDRAKGG